MSAEGFGCLFLPSVTPHTFPVGAEFGSASLLASGIGMSERMLPGMLVFRLGGFLVA